MYGTVAQMRVKAGRMDDLVAELRSEEPDWDLLPGTVAVYWYRLDGDPTALILVVIFDSRAAYFANANSPEQHERHMRVRALLEEDPIWHDGEVETYMRF